MPQFELSERYLHEEGVFAAQLVEYQEESGQFGPRIRWVFETSEVRDDGEAARIFYWTSLKISPKSKLGELLAALRVRLPQTPEEAADFDADGLIGAACRLRIEHQMNGGETYANIVGLLPVASAKPKPKPKPKGTEATDADTVDPFADE